MYKVLLLGASGSIGTQTVDVLLNKLNKNYELVGFSVGKRTDFVDEYLSKISTVKYVCVQDENLKGTFESKYKEVKFYYGSNGLLELIEDSNSDIVVNALTGFSGLLPSINSLSLNKILCLANKESLVVGGEIINNLLLEGHGKLYPIDSEHVAIAKCLYNKNIDNIEEILITASGGPFFNLSNNEFKNITPEKALAHPTWKMGNKITIDSSTMMNKAFEIAEAYYLYGVDKEKIKPIVDRKSLVHSLVKYKNGDIYLNVGPSDMRIPIYYALTFGKCEKEKFDDVEINTFQNYKFYEMDYAKFPLINYGKEIISKKGNFGAIVNAANEEAVYAFLDNKINYLDIKFIIDKMVAMYPYIEHPSIDEILKTDKDVRGLVNQIIESKSL